MFHLVEAISLEDLTNEYMRCSIMSGEFGSLEKMISDRIVRQEAELKRSKEQLAAIVRLTQADKQPELPLKGGK